jgi:hypothetical protein
MESQINGPCPEGTPACAKAPAGRLKPSKWFFYELPYALCPMLFSKLMEKCV